mmetsp:Transcript_61522/g.116267  ORF Transcript_61522/g.116267 Transcript_61522/m.116267 type:complete len:117 (+) Transcript_61522:1-351(+)
MVVASAIKYDDASSSADSETDVIEEYAQTETEIEEIIIDELRNRRNSLHADMICELNDCSYEEVMKAASQLQNRNIILISGAGSPGSYEVILSLQKRNKKTDKNQQNQNKNQSNLP